MNRTANFPDLDALVLAEIESIGKGKRRRARRGPPTLDRRTPVSPGTSHPEAATVSRLHEDRPAANVYRGEEAEGLLEESGDDPGLADGGDEGPLDLMGVEEQAFVTRAVGFLSGRPNAGMILDQIWGQVAAASDQDGAPVLTEGPAPAPAARPSPAGSTEG